MKVVILAAGNGKRMWPLTETRPKALLPIVGKPIAYHQMVEIKKAGIKDFIFVIREHKEMLINYLSKIKNELDVHIEFVEQGPNNGTGAALLSAAGKINDRFVVVGGDLIFDASILKAVMDAHEGGITISVKRVDNPERYGIVEVADGRVCYFEEKPKSPHSNLANLSIYCMDPNVLDSLKTLKKSVRGEYEIVDLFVGAKAVEVDGYWRDVGYPWDLLDANADMLKRLETKNGEMINSTVSGRLVMEEGARIIGSYIEGDVYIGKNTIIGPNAYIRGPSAIGANCHIGESVTVKSSVLFDDVNAKHLTYIGDSVVGQGVNFGAGTQVANFRFDESNVNVLTEKGWVNSGRRKFGAAIGDNVKFGVLSATMPGKLIGPGSWIHSGVIVNRNVPSNVYVFVRQELHYNQIGPALKEHSHSSERRTEQEG
ncbi:MAG: sugar phosphate nucleotidyltransferase [Candidatus Bilamarchaeaceae archaeon]